MKEWLHHPALILFAGFLAGLIASCDLNDPDPGPDDPLPILHLNPEMLVAGILQSSTPDSFGAGTVTRVRFDLTTGTRDAIRNGAAVELVFRISEGVPAVSGWMEDTDTWESLEIETVATLDDSLDNWWREAWIDPVEGERLIGVDGSARFRISPAPRSTQTVLRVVEIPPRLKITRSIGRVVAASDNELLLQNSDTPTLIRRDIGGNKLGEITSVSPPLSLCYLGDRYFGVNSSEIRHLPDSGGTWQRLAVIPWGESSAYALTTDGTDLYLIRRPHQYDSAVPHVLYRLSVEQLLNTSSFNTALIDSSVLERNGLVGGSLIGFAYWSGERQLVVPGRQLDQFGLVTFTRAGRFRSFIPVPFLEWGITFAFVGDHLFVTGAIPTRSSIRWEGRYDPIVPGKRLLYRWRVP